jgi:DNA repair exonuclease SbcCD ATPase subunit
MPKYSIQKLVIGGLTLFLILGFLLADTSAQKRRRKRKSTAPQITNPAIYQPSPGDSSNAAGDTNNNNSVTEPQPTKTPSEDPEEMKRTIRSLSSQVDKLSDKLGQMEEAQRSLVDLERLSRAEQRSAQLHSDLRDVSAKEADLQARLEDIEFALKPENIERATAVYGTVHPEELREQRRKTLENEKQRVQKQLSLLADSHTRLEQSIAATDAELDRLHKKLDAADQAAIQNAKTKAQAEESQPAPSPSPSPSP